MSSTTASLACGSSVCITATDSPASRIMASRRLAPPRPPPRELFRKQFSYCVHSSGYANGCSTTVSQGLSPKVQGLYPNELVRLIKNLQVFLAFSAKSRELPPCTALYQNLWQKCQCNSLEGFPLPLKSVPHGFTWRDIAVEQPPQPSSVGGRDHTCLQC